MEAGMKEDIKKRHGYTKTKELFAFDNGLAERQAAIIIVARPTLAALSALDSVGGRMMLRLWTPMRSRTYWRMLWFYLIGNANFRLNEWRQKRFSEFLTEVGKRTLGESIPADKHLLSTSSCQVLLAQGCAPMRTLSTLIGRMSHASQTGIMMEVCAGF